MEVNKINSVSQLGFEGKKDKSQKPSGNDNNMSYPQMDAPASKKASNGMKYLLYAAMGLAGAGSMASCNKDAFGIGAESTSISDASAKANAWYTPVCPEIIRDTIHVHHRDTVEVPGPHTTDTVRVPEYHRDTVYFPKVDTVYVPKVVEKHDTTYIPQIQEKHDTVYVPQVVEKHDTTYIPQIQEKHDTVYVPKVNTVHDTIYVPKVETKYDTVYVPKVETVHDTVYVPKVETVHDTVYVPKIETVHDTVYVPKVDTVYVPEYHTDTVYVDKYIVEKDTVIQQVIQPINVKDAPWNVIDLLINQGLNVGIPLEGPEPKSVGENHVLFLGSRAYNEYDYKLYETQLDSIGTSGDGNGNGTLCLVSKITSYYDDNDPSVTFDNPKISYMKTNVIPAPGGIQLERYVMSGNVAARVEKNSGTGYPVSFSHEWNYAGKETRQMAGDGKNIVTVYDKYDNPMNGKFGEIIKGDQAGDFLYGRYIYDENGNPYVGDDGAPEEAFYDFSKGKMWSTEVKKVEGSGQFTWK